MCVHIRVDIYISFCFRKEKKYRTINALTGNKKTRHNRKIRKFENVKFNNNPNDISQINTETARTEFTFFFFQNYCFVFSLYYEVRDT